MPVRAVGTAGPNPTCPLCETNVRTICTGKYESEEFARRVSRAGGTPVVVAGVRSPFGYYVSHYFYALHAQQQHRDPPHRRLGAAWFSSKHAVCLQKNRTSESCRAMTHVYHSPRTARVDSSKGLELFMNYYVGNIQTHYSRPFVGLGSTRGDWPRLSARLTVYTRSTRLPYPVSECPLTQIPAARCYGEYYDAAAPGLLDRVREHDSWTFSCFDYPRVPGATCLPRGGALAAGHSTSDIEARDGTDRAYR